jgi:hypothetical protein
MMNSAFTQNQVENPVFYDIPHKEPRYKVHIKVAQLNQVPEQKQAVNMLRMSYKVGVYWKETCKCFY